MLDLGLDPCTKNGCLYIFGVVLQFVGDFVGGGSCNILVSRMFMCFCSQINFVLVRYFSSLDVWIYISFHCVIVLDAYGSLLLALRE